MEQDHNVKRFGEKYSFSVSPTNNIKFDVCNISIIFIGMKFVSWYNNCKDVKENILKPEIKENEKEIATIKFFKKNNGEKEYIIKILVKFFTDLNMSYKDLAPKISIICHNHLPNKTEIEEYKESNDANKFINVLITSIVSSEEYNIEKLSEELKRNINGVATVSILSLDKK